MFFVCLIAACCFLRLYRFVLEHNLFLFPSSIFLRSFILLSFIAYQWLLSFNNWRRNQQIIINSEIDAKLQQHNCYLTVFFSFLKEFLLSVRHTYWWMRTFGLAECCWLVLFVSLNWPFHFSQKRHKNHKQIFGVWKRQQFKSDSLTFLSLTSNIWRSETLSKEFFCFMITQKF